MSMHQNTLEKSSEQSQTDSLQSRLPWISACLLMASAIIFGAFGAHLLKGLSPKAMGWWETGTRYLLASSLGALVLSLFNDKRARVAQWLLSIGILIFSGSLYIMAVTNIRWLGAVTPIGGTLMIIAWLIAAFTIRPQRHKRS